MSDSFVIFAFIAVIIFLVIKMSSHKKEPKEPQERDEFDEHLGVPSLFIPPASSFPPVAPPVAPPATPPAASPVIENNVPPVARDNTVKKRVMKLPELLHGFLESYRYTDVGIFVPEDSTFDLKGFEPGAILTLVQDPENPHDNHAVGLKLHNQLVGYLYRGKLQDMANDWIEKNLPLRAQLTACTRDRNRAEVTLVFYGLRQYEKHLSKYPDAKQYRLIGTKKAEFQENLSLCECGEYCTLDYDVDSGKYLVAADLEIGYLPSSAANLIERDGEDAYDIFISDIFDNDNGTLAVRVYLFPKDD